MMKYMNLDPSIQGAEDAEDISVATSVLEKKLVELDLQLAQFPELEPKRAEFLLDYGLTALELEKNFDAWQVAQEAFKIFAATEDWEKAVQACNIMFAADQSDSLVALGNGVWLAVTFPIDPELSAVMLEHIVDETPDDSDGGAIAATTAHYLASLRVEESKRENLLFFTNQLLARVARRHSNVENQADFDAWRKKLELNTPDEFLGRLAQILNVMVQDDWWVDKEDLWAKMPVE